MPALMIHLLLAKKIKPNGSILYYIGNIAPDAVADWKAKDITHFRNLTDRAGALAALARRTPPADDFAEGVLLHLYLDWRWDLAFRDEYIKTAGDNWVERYRSELNLSGSYAFHRTEWAKDLWKQMAEFDMTGYGEIPGASPAELKNLLSQGYKWHLSNKTGPSAVFTPEMIDEFLNKTALEYTSWKIEQEIAYYKSLPVVFTGFAAVPGLSDGEIELFCLWKMPPAPENNHVPAYQFLVHLAGRRIGDAGLHAGYTDSIYYGGQINYCFHENRYNNMYGEKICRLLLPVIRAHGMHKIIITGNYTNTAVRHTCEKLGAKLIRTAPLPSWHDYYKKGMRFVNIYEWDINRYYRQEQGNGANKNSKP